jgi:REP element-mobilizing transposase RayT
MQTRKNIRLKEYDYSSKGMYFITICTKDKKDIFGKIVDNKIIFNDYGNKLNDILMSFENEKYEIDYYQIMPNHIHFIVNIREGNMIDLSKVISQIKSKCTNLIKYKNLWQKNYYERVVRDEKEYNDIVKYIYENPYRDKYGW